MADEERYEAEARDWLDGVDVPPPRLEVAQIVQIGRSQVRRRRLLTAGGTVAALAALAAVPAMVPLLPSGGAPEVGSAPLPVLDCEVTELPMPDEYAEPEDDVFPDVWIAGMDPTGRYVIGNGPYQWEDDGSTSGYNPNGMVLWEDGNPTAMTAPGDGGSAANAVNADGVVVGDEWIYRDGAMSELPVPDGYASVEATAINAAGDVAGMAYTEDFSSYSVVVWPAGNLDDPHVLAVPDVSASAEGITDDGTVVGQLTVERDGAFWEDGGYLWRPDGTRQELRAPADATEVVIGGVRGNWVVGRANLPLPPASVPADPEPSPAPPPATTYEVTILWDLAAGTFQVRDVGSSSELTTGVSAAGDVLYEEPMLTRDGETYALPDPIGVGAVVPPDSEYAPTITTEAISDDGSTIVGSVFINDTPDRTADATHPVIWRC
jgi:uncharacterized membrane protein